MPTPIEALVRPPGGGSALQILSQIDEHNRYAFDQACRVKAIELAAKLDMHTLLSINSLPNAVYQPAACLAKTFEAAGRFQFPLHLMFEVTENEPGPRCRASSIDFLGIQKHGIITAIDEFGAGHSGLNMLADFQPGVLKIDMALTRSIHADPVRTHIARAIIGLCQGLHISVIAEGIETFKRRSRCASLGCGCSKALCSQSPLLNSYLKFPRPLWTLCADRMNSRFSKQIRSHSVLRWDKTMSAEGFLALLCRS